MEPVYRTLIVGDRVHFRDSSVQASGTVIEKVGHWHVLVKWDDTSTISAHWAHSLEVGAAKATTVEAGE